MKQEIVVPGEKVILRKTFFFFFFRRNLKELRGLACGYLKKEN